MRILAFESSCDDTSVALLEAEPSTDAVARLISFSVQSQNEVHQKFGGVVPELASRAHLQNLIPCLEKVLSEGNTSLSEIDLFAATSSPGLIGCLLIGHTAAKTLSMIHQKPFVSCHHIESHVMSVFLEHRPRFPFIAVVVSGGHTSLYRVTNYDEMQLVGLTIDDAMGEAFDKAAKALGLPLPGGPEIDRLAKSGDRSRYPFGRVRVPGYDFSFSGLKSELIRSIQRAGVDLAKSDMAASFQEALIDHLFQRLDLLLKAEPSEAVVFVGGVASNSRLRERAEAMVREKKVAEVFFPSLKFCTDNAAMVGMRAYRHFLMNQLGGLEDDVSSTKRPSVASRRVA